MNFEFTQEKNRVRSGIEAQILQMVDQERKTSVTMESLPGENWIFETSLHEKLVFKGIKTSFYCYERDDKLYRKLAKSVPKGIYSYTRADFCQAMDDIKQEKGLTDVVWADYCGQPDFNTIGKPLQMFRHGAKLVYMTFCTNLRMQKKSMKSLLPDSVSKDVTKAIIEQAEAVLKKMQMTSKIRLVYLNSYVGIRAPMITIGFSKVNGITPIRHVRNKKTNASKIDSKKVIKVYRSFGGRRNTSKEKLPTITEKVAKELNLSKHQVAGVLAHHRNPNSWANK